MAEDTEIQEFSEEPDVDALKGDLERCRSNLSYYLDQAEEARDVRMNNWPGKGKYGQKTDPDSFPWQNASDLEPNLVNPLIDGDVAILKSALNAGNLIAAPTESGDIGSSKMVTEFMRWRLSTMDELPREAGVAANYLLEQGICFLGVYFSREVRRVLQPITLQEISAISPEIATAIADPDMKTTVLEMLQGSFPNLSKKRMNRMIKELREDGATEIPREKITKNRPAIRAYELGRDLIVDSNILDLQSARAIYCVHYYSPEQLKEKVLTEGFDEDFANEVIENTTGSTDNTYTSGYADALGSYMAEAPEQYQGLVRLITAYRREIDEDGVPVCSVTTFSESAEGFAKTYTMSVDAGRYPFVAITRETISRRLLDSRGYPELLRSYQLAVKTEMDSRRDRASLSTVPPITYTVGRKPQGGIGAGTMLPIRRPGEVSYLTPPQMTGASTEVEMQLRTLADKLTGRATSQTDAVEANMIRQSMINNWLHGFAQIMKRMWAMDRAYNQEVWFRVTNNAQGMNLIMDETASDYDFNITYNALNMDEEKVVQKLETVGKIMAQYDRQGTARYDVFLRTFLDAIDPNLASQLIMPQQEATTKEIIETSSDLAKISSGQVVNVPQGANAQLRLQVLQQYLQGTNEIPAEDVQQRLQQDEKFRQRMETYQKQLQFQVTQQQNAQIGAIGTAPGNVPGSAAA
jgi:hypothetical protein